MPGRVVIADAGPLHYLVLIGCSDILPTLFETVFIPHNCARRIGA
jgi:hypothetical protein